MLEKTMKQVLTKKINNWLVSIDDDTVVKAIKKDLIITGGAFTSMIQNQVPNDFDCYFRTKDTVLKVANYYADKWNTAHIGQKNRLGYELKVMVLDGANPSADILNYFNITDISQSSAVMVRNTPPERVKMIFPSDGIVGDLNAINAPEELGISSEELELLDEVNNETSAVNITESLDEIPAEELEKNKPAYFPVFISTNAITLSNKIQIVIRFYGDPADIHDTYDYEHTKAYFDFGKDILEIPKRVYELTMNTTLVYTGSKYPVCSLFRMRKFIDRGWKINAGQIVKMCLQVSELDLNNIEVLEDQLIGVDSLYFMELIRQFRVKQLLDPNWTMDSTYLISIIDKIF